MGYWVFKLQFHFSWNKLQLSFLLIVCTFLVLDCLHHFLQPCVCIFLGTAQAFIVLKLPFLNFLELFICVFLRLLEFFDEFYDFSFTFCVLPR